MGTADRAVGDNCVLSAFGRQKRGSEFKVCIADLEMCTHMLQWCVIYVQDGIAPLAQRDVTRFPFFQANYGEPRTQRLHFMWGNLSRLDAEKNDPTPTAKPRCDWFDKEGVFLNRVDKLPTYGRSYMHLFMKAAKGWGPFGRKLRSVRSPDGVEEMIAKTMTM